jgi:hypothetical protein
MISETSKSPIDMIEDGAGDVSDRTSLVAARLKKLYKNQIFPAEKRYQYDSFFDSPLLSDVEFDGTCFC